MLQPKSKCYLKILKLQYDKQFKTALKEKEKNKMSNFTNENKL